MTRDEALAIARRAQKEPTPIGVTMPDMLAERTADDLLKAFDAGAEAERSERFQEPDDFAAPGIRERG